MGRDGREHRLAVEARAAERAAAARADRDSRQVRRAESQRGHLADPPAGRRALSVEARAVVGVSHRARWASRPKPYYDPLEFAVEEAHRRGLQLHVWFNPYRVRRAGCEGRGVARSCERSTREDIVRKYGEYLWFDPGEPAAEEHFIAVLNDVVKRYDIDGVHIDDYFYPYQVKDEDGQDRSVSR